MKKFLAIFFVLLLNASIAIQTVEANTRIRKNTPARAVTTQYHVATPVIYHTLPHVSTNISTQTYHYSPVYIQGYTYYSTPVPGYYYYPATRNSNTTYIQHPTTNNQHHTPQNYAPGSATVSVYSN